MYFSVPLLIIYSVLFTMSLAVPVQPPHRVIRLQPVPGNFLDWPAFARRQVLTSMDHEVAEESTDTADGDVRHIIHGPMNLASASDVSSDESLPGVVMPEESSSWSSSSWSSSKYPAVSPENWLSYRQIYNYLSGNREPIQEESSVSIVSWASLENSYRNSEVTDEQ